MIITNTFNAILIVAVIALLLSGVIPHTQSAFDQIMKFKQHPDNPTIGNIQPYMPPQINNNPLGLMVSADEYFNAKYVQGSCSFI